MLFLGRPGVGKTTVIREMARVLADDLRKRVVRHACPTLPFLLPFISLVKPLSCMRPSHQIRRLADRIPGLQVIVDTSNEIGGDGDVPHPAIGGARRMQVPDPSQQHRVMVRTPALACFAPCGRIGSGTHL